MKLVLDFLSNLRLLVLVLPNQDTVEQRNKLAAEMIDDPARPA